MRPETPPKKLSMEGSFVANQKMTSSSPHLVRSVSFYAWLAHDFAYPVLEIPTADGFFL